MARTRIMYIELKTGYDGDGPAWISRVSYSKTEKSLRWKGRLLQHATADEREQYGWTEGNYFDFESRRAYWASGAKRDGKDRLAPHEGKLTVDEDVREDYEKLLRGE
jgi:hypothetical protein